MNYSVITKDCVNKIYTDDDPEIEMFEFKTKEEAEYYLRYGNIKEIEKNNIINVFTDGSCSMNGSINARAGIGIYFGEGDKKNVSKRINGKQTNNTAELSAVIEVFRVLKEEIEQGKNVIIYTDSEYVLRCCTSYGLKCEKNNWEKSGGIPNVELIKSLYSLYNRYNNVQIQWLREHTKNKDKLSIGNEGADNLAKKALQ